MNCKERFYFTATGLPDVHFHVVRFTGTERLGRGYFFRINLVTDRVSIKPVSLIANTCIFSIVRQNGERVIYSGHCKAVLNEGTASSGYSYITVEFVPKFLGLDYIIESKIFLDKNLPNLIEEVLRSSQYVHIDHEIRFSKKYPVQEFSMQYNESAYKFLCYKLEEQGAYFFFDETGEKIIFADSPQAHNKSVGTFRYVPVNGMRQDEHEEIIASFTGSLHAVPGKVVVRNYDWKDPNRMIVSMVDTVKEASAITTAVLNDEAVESQEEADRIAKIRSEQLISQRYVGKGESFTPYLHAGTVFSLSEHPNELFNQEVMITEITHEGNQEAYIAFALGIPLESHEKYFYHNIFSCIPAALPFHPERKTSRTVISGMITAFIDGDTAEAPVLDKYGRYKVLFPFDLSGRSAGKASCWIRRMQEQIGKDSGMTFPLLPGTEVSLSFINGNPDRPIISGALPNGETGSLSGSANKNFSGIRTPGGAQLTFDNDHNAISLANCTGSGIKFGSGSLDYLSEETHISLAMHSIGSSAFGGLFQGLLAGFTSAQTTGCGKAKKYILAALTAVATSSEKILSSISEYQDTYDAKNKFEWGASAAKMAAAIVGMAGILVKASAAQKGTPYNMIMTAERDTVKTFNQCFPSKTELVADTVLLLLGRAGSIVLDSVDASKQVEAYNAESTGDVEAYRTCLFACMDKIYALGDSSNYYDLNALIFMSEEERNKYSVNGEYHVKAENSPCAYYATTYSDMKKIQEALEIKIYEDNAKLNGDAVCEENRKEWTAEVEKAEQVVNDLKYLEDKLYLTYDNACEEKDTKKEYYAYKKQQAVRNVITEQVSALLPELAVIISLFMSHSLAGKKDAGGIMIDAKDKNINIHAQSYIGQHAERGIYLRTRELKEWASWGPPRLHALPNTVDNNIADVFTGSKAITLPIEIAEPEDGAEREEPTVENYIKHGHANVVIENKAGAGVKLPVGKGAENTFIATDTHLFYAKNDFSIHKTERSFTVFSSNINLKAGAFIGLDEDQYVEAATFVLDAAGTAVLKTINNSTEDANIGLCAEDEANEKKTLLALNSADIFLGIPRGQDKNVHAVTITNDSITLASGLQDEGNAPTSLSLGKKKISLYANPDVSIELNPDGTNSAVINASGGVVIGDILFQGSDIKRAKKGQIEIGDGAIKVSGMPSLEDVDAFYKNFITKFTEVSNKVKELEKKLDFD